MLRGMRALRNGGRFAAPRRRGSASGSGLITAAARVSTVILLAVLPAVLLGVLLAGDDVAFDFRQFWQGGRDILDGVSPYPTEAQLAAAGDQLGPRGIQEVFRFPYPAGSAVAMVPLAALPFDLAAAVLIALSVAAVASTLWLLGVRDWRCYGVLFLSITALGAIRLGTLTPLLAFGLAVMWRYRRDDRIVGAALGGCIVLKVFLWPLAVWLLATRRFRAAAVAACGAAAMTLVSWLAIGFAGFGEYPELVRRLSDVVADRGYSLVALGSSLGLGERAELLPWLVGGLVLGAAAWVTRREDGDRQSFSLAIVAAILLTPIVWLHYFLLLAVPLALARPRLSAAWLLLLVFWLTPYQETDGELWRIALAWATAVAVAWMAVSGRSLSTAFVMPRQRLET